VSLRSWLFVPGDSDRKLMKSEAVAADALIFDLEDSVAPEQKREARRRVREYLASRRERPAELWVRINALDGPLALDDLVEILGGQPAGIVLPKVRGPRDVIMLGHYLDALEAQHGIDSGSTRILPVTTEIPEAIFRLGDYTSCGRRLFALTWGAEDLSTATGAISNQDATGGWTSPFQLARSLCLFGAHAAGVAAIDTIHANVRDISGLRTVCEAARRDGFSGKVAVHPDQVAVINESFTPSEHETAGARRIVDLFAANPGVAALMLDGRMVDIPHLRQAEAILAKAARFV
jgi:citrate lyase subunit beta/citryl-CoA lyase